jgi:transposase
MGAAYSQDLRERILAAYDRGMMTKTIAELFRVSPAWARRLKQRRRESGQISPRPMGGVRIVKVDMTRLRELVEQQADATTRELHQRLGCACGESAVGMALRRLGLSFKKRRSTPPSRTGPTSLRTDHAGSTISQGMKRRG